MSVINQDELKHNPLPPLSIPSSVFTAAVRVFMCKCVSLCPCAQSDVLLISFITTVSDALL